MADVTLTAASVVAGTGAIVVEGTAGATIAQGKVVVLNTSNEYVLADCTDGDLDAAAGFALTASIDNGPIKVLTGGNMTTAAQLTAGTVYVLSESGLIAPLADWLVATDYLTVMGVATSTSNLKVPNSGPIVTAYGATG
ncbi:MAG: hypothetical protein LC121_27195 [Anaerolineae bacterium]|nr:hypothetical protein [Anaerolineae bacterium]MCZ2099883.1 hypothetical protein [Anaerolineae bacterium]